MEDLELTLKTNVRKSKGMAEIIKKSSSIKEVEEEKMYSAKVFYANGTFCGTGSVKVLKKLKEGNNLVKVKFESLLRPLQHTEYLPWLPRPR